MENILKAIKDGVMIIGGWKIPCAVLNNGTRVISQRAFMQLFEFKGRGKNLGHRIAHLIEHPALKSPFYKDLSLAIRNPIPYKTLRGPIAYGYECGIIIDYCKALIEARRTGLIAVSYTHPDAADE